MTKYFTRESNSGTLINTGKSCYIVHALALEFHKFYLRGSIFSIMRSLTRMSSSTEFYKVLIERTKDSTYYNLYFCQEYARAINMLKN